MSILEALLVQLTAGGLFATCVVVFLYVVGIFPMRRKFEKFFGITKNRTIDIYLSNLWDPAQGNSWGEIIAGSERNGSKALSDIFATASPSLPDLLIILFRNVRLKMKYTVNVPVSPETFTPSFAQKSLIVIGASTKNSVRNFYLNNGSLLATIEGEPRNRPPVSSPNPLGNKVLISKSNQIVWSTQNDKLPAIIERLELEEGGSKKTLIFCVGKTSTETKIACEYLARNWKDLEKACRDKRQFARCLSISTAGDVENFDDFH